MSVHYALDSLVVRGRRMFGWGFCLDTDTPSSKARCALRWRTGVATTWPCYRAATAKTLPACIPAWITQAGPGSWCRPCCRRRRPTESPPCVSVVPASGSSWRCPASRGLCPSQAIPLRSVWRRFGQVARERGIGAALVAALRGGVQRLVARREHGLEWTDRGHEAPCSSSTMAWAAGPPLPRGEGGGVARRGQARGGREPADQHARFPRRSARGRRARRAVFPDAGGAVGATRGRRCGGARDQQPRRFR